MRNYDPATAAHLGGARDIVAHVLVWITARDRTTGAAESIGFWTGDDHQDFVIAGENRTYFGAGDMLEVPAITAETGLQVRMHSLRLAALAPEVALALRGHEPRLAPVELHRVLYHALTGVQVAEPHRVLAGWIDEAQITTPEIGGQGSATITIASSARALTRTLPICKSDAQQRLRSGDRFRRYVDVSGAVDVVWGAARGKVGGGAATGPTTPVRPTGDRGGRD